MNYLWNIFIFLAFTQLLAFCLFWRRLERRYARMLLTGLFLAGNLPWLIFLNVFRDANSSLTRITALILRCFTSWQIGIVLWLMLAGAVGMLILILFRLPLLVIHRKQRTSHQDTPQNPGRRTFLVKTIKRTVWGSVLCGSAWGILRTELGPRTVKHTLFPKELPKALDGLIIAHISDLHIGLWTAPNLVPHVLALTRDLRPDMVVITGDIIDHRPSLSNMLLQHLYLLDKVPLGVYGIIGNHDIYTGAKQITDALTSGGITMLRDRHHALLNEGLPLALVGVDDPGRDWSGSGGRINLEKATAGLDKSLFPILLSHRPTGFDQAHEAGIPLTLCGHTHGGQFGLPGGPNLADPFYDFTHGLYKHQGNLVYVTAGIGSVGLPFRLGVPAEIALLKLSSSSIS